MVFVIAILKRHKSAKRSEQISLAQGSLLDDLISTDLEAIEAELKALHPTPAQAAPHQQPKRAPLPPQFPRNVIHHEPDSTQCACGCQLQRIGQDVSGSWTIRRACSPSDSTFVGNGPAGARDGGQVRRPPASLSTGKNLRPCRPGHPVFDTCAVGGVNRRAASAAGRCAT